MYQVSADTGSPRHSMTEGGSSQGQAGFERRVAWLEEDVAVLHRRLRDECGEGGAVGAAGDSGLRALVARLDGELSAERRSREALEVRMAGFEESLRHERKERETQLRGFSNELETTMRGLIGRIDEGLSAGAAAMRERTDNTEERIRSLIKHVDEGLSAGAAALQDTLTSTGALNDQELAEAFGGLGQLAGRQPVRQNPIRAEEHEVLSEQLVQSHQRQENQRLIEQRIQLNVNGNRPVHSGSVPTYIPNSSQGIAASANPNLGIPQSMLQPQPGSGLQPGQARLVQSGAASGYAQRAPQAGLQRR